MAISCYAWQVGKIGAVVLWDNGIGVTQSADKELMKIIIGQQIRLKAALSLYGQFI